MLESNNQMHGLIAHFAVVVGVADPARSAETRNAVITESADMRAFADSKSAFANEQEQTN